MTVDITLLGAGDVLCMHADASLTEHTGAWLIQRGPLMKAHPWQPWKWFGKSPTLFNHVAMFTHLDSDGHHRGLEGRPGGFGWKNLDSYLADPNTIGNVRQPKTAEQRASLVAAATAMIGTPYDWRAILSFAAEASGLGFNAKEWPDEGLPSQVVCSTSLDFLYEGRHLDNPGGSAETRGTDPTDWGAFITTNGYG